MGLFILISPPFFLGDAAKILPMVISCPTFNPSYPFVAFNTQPHPIEYLVPCTFYMFFLVPHSQSREGPYLFPKSQPIPGRRGCNIAKYICCWGGGGRKIGGP